MPYKPTPKTIAKQAVVANTNYYNSFPLRLYAFAGGPAGRSGIKDAGAWILTITTVTGTMSTGMF